MAISANARPRGRYGEPMPGDYDYLFAAQTDPMQATRALSLRGKAAPRSADDVASLSLPSGDPINVQLREISDRAREDFCAAVSRAEALLAERPRFASAAVLTQDPGPARSADDQSAILIGVPLTSIRVEKISANEAVEHVCAIGDDSQAATGVPVCSTLCLASDGKTDDIATLVKRLSGDRRTANAAAVELARRKDPRGCAALEGLSQFGSYPARTRAVAVRAALISVCR